MARHYLPWLVVAPLIGIASLDAGRHLHRRDPHARDAQCHAGIGRLLCGLVAVPPMVIRQSTALGGADGAERCAGLTMWRLYPRRGCG